MLVNPKEPIHNGVKQKILEILGPGLLKTANKIKVGRSVYNHAKVPLRTDLRATSAMTRASLMDSDFLAGNPCP
ncbi:hypothetical protein [Bacillus sp. OK048]|uniref:hypothetical protein n=1 Tax=Bacillus sp. OK048 TaxID=1882761 RepID=UPI000B8683AE|nr:hypothetical protein [Bacillus sp. OK048]